MHEHVAAAPVASVAVQAAPKLTGCGWVNIYQDWNVQTAAAVCEAESSGDPNATGYNRDGSIDRGIMQINSVHADMVSSLASLYDPSTNVTVAHKIWTANGFTAWNAYKSGKYLKYL